MRFLIAAIFLITSSFVTDQPEWKHNFKEAILNAQEQHKFILVNFSGSDWCGPCIRLHKEVFGLIQFAQLANDKLILVNADFPRYKKNQLSPAQQKINDELAEKFNSKGIFPLTVLIDESGKSLKSWEGFPSSPTDFINDIQQTIQDNQK